MKKFLKLLLCISFILFGSYILFNLVYSKIVTNNLTKNVNMIQSNWQNFITLKNEKNEKILHLFHFIHDSKKSNDSLMFFIKNKFNNENVIFKTTSLKLFVINEYGTNLYSIKFLKEKVLENDETDKLKSEINLINNKLNLLINEYNNDVKNFNTYRSTFPNYFIANKNNIKNIEFFNIKYGEENKNPKIKSNIEKWIETGDSIYLQ